MARSVYYAFHYDDIWRANVVRKSRTVRSAGEEVGYYDHSLWEQAKTQGADAIKRLIDEGIKGASAQTHNLGMGLLGIYISNIRDQHGYVTAAGPNPMASVTIDRGILGKVPLANIYPTYDWVSNDGSNNAAAWIEQAALDAGR